VFENCEFYGTTHWDSNKGSPGKAKKSPVDWSYWPDWPHRTRVWPLHAVKRSCTIATMWALV